MGNTGNKDDADRTIRASGVLPFRREGGDIRVLVIHRPRYDDWSFPKGKLDKGESDETAALREMAEETGVHGTLGEELPTALYEDHKGRPKEVRYWLMELTADQPEEFTANDEVDRIEWLSVDEARERLTYPLDGALLDEALLALNSEGTA